MNLHPKRHRLLFTPGSKDTDLDPFKVKTYAKPNHTLNTQSLQLDFGTLNEFKLDDLVDLQSDGFSEFKRVRLAFVEKNALHLDEQGLQLFQRYGKSELSFIGLYGKACSGKSLLLDKIANLCQMEGSSVIFFTTQFSVDPKKSQLKGLYIGSVPLSKGNLKIFTLDIDGYEDQEHQSYFMLLDLMLLVCSAFLALAGPQDIQFEQLESVCRHVSKARKRFKDDSEQIATYWPDHLYVLFRQISLKNKRVQTLSQLFSEFNFTSIGDAMDSRVSKEHKNADLREAELLKFGRNKKLISEEYITRISSVVRDIYYKLEVKSYMNFRYTGTNLAKLAVNAVQALNLKGQLNIQRVFVKSMKELYMEAYAYHTQMYNQCLVEYLEDEEPLEADYLMKVFEQCSEEILGSFNQLKANEQLLELYTDKLEKYIGDKERCVIEINRKKTKKKIQKTLPAVKSTGKIDEYTELISRVKTLQKSDEQVLAETMSKHVLSGMKTLQSKHKSQVDPLLVQKSIEYSKKVELRRSELQKMVRQSAMRSSQTEKNEIIRSNLMTKEEKLNNQLEILRSELPLANSVVESARKSKSMEKLKIEEMKLRKGVQRRQKMIEQLKKNQGSHISNQSETTNEMIAQLMREIELKKSQQKELANVIASQPRALTSIQVIRSHTSLASGMSPRKTQSRPFKSKNANIRIIPYSKV